MAQEGRPPSFLAGGGEMGALMRGLDWRATPVGSPRTWSQALKTTVRLVLSSRHPMFIWWGEALTCFYNDAYSALIGPDRHPSALGRPGREVWAEIWDVIGPQIDFVMAARGATWHERQLIPITRGGVREDVWWTYGYSPIDDAAAATGVGGVLVICRDVTAEVRAEETLRRLNETLAQRVAAAMAEREAIQAQLAQAQKMEAMGQLTGGVAHDFNNLLQVITGNLDSLRRRVAELAQSSSKAELLRFAEGALRGAERAAAVTRQLLAFSRRQPLTPKPVIVDTLVLGLSDLLRGTLGESIDIETAAAAELWPVSVDANQLESALLNLAVNARDAMPMGGKLTIATANVVLDDGYAATHHAVAAGDYVLIAVTDTGSGMRQEIADQAFDPFFTTKNVGHGTGLGLSQVYGFVKQSGGHVTIHSTIGEGTTVKLYLPRLRAKAKVAQPRSAAAPAPRSRAGEMVLLVEDDDDVRATTDEMLRGLGYGVITAADGAAALRLVEERPDIRLLFTDVGLPGGLDGRQLAEAARAIRPKLPVLFTSGHERDAVVRRGRLGPDIELLAKPFTYAGLAHKLREVLELHDTVA